jgi:tRNA-2-methylthio-N6-dimethylallyladenosine synthase
MSKKLIEAVATLDKVCEQLSLPVQSGSDEILTMMRRGYTAEQYKKLIAEIKSKIPGVALSTDVIVGFPSESEGQFQETLGLLSELKFDSVHIAAYSQRGGTIAARELEDNIPAGEKKRRLDEVERLQEAVAAEINARLLGETVEVLVEGKKKGRWYGRTRSGKIVFFSDSSDYLGKLVNIIIERTSPWSLQGKVRREK